MTQPDILLVNAPFAFTQEPPLGCAYLARYLKTEGFSAEVLDLNILLRNFAAPEQVPLWDVDVGARSVWWKRMKTANQDLHEELNYLVERVLEYPARYVGFSIFYSNMDFSAQFAQKIKKQDPDRFIIFGGPSADGEGNQRSLSNCGVDAFVVGDGEIALVELLQALQKGERYKAIPGVAWVKDHEPQPYQHRLPIQDLGKVPFPTFDEFEGWRYSTPDQLPVIFSRGCIFKCAFCSDWVLQGNYRFRPPRHIFDELFHHYQTRHIQVFYCHDLAVNGNPKYLRMLCEMLIELNQDFHWSANAILLKVYAREDFDIMRRAGCHGLQYGLESASAKVLKLMRKHFDPKDAARVLKDSHDAGLQTTINIICGFPGESEADFQETLDFMRENRPYIDLVGALSPCYVPSITDMETHPEKYGIRFPDEADEGSPFPERGIHWTDQEGNTYEKRLEKVQRVREVMKEIDLPMAECKL